MTKHCGTLLRLTGLVRGPLPQAMPPGQLAVIGMALATTGYTCDGWVQLFRLEVDVSEVLANDVRSLRTALRGSVDKVVRVTLELPRASAEKVLALLDAERTTGAVVIPVRETFTTTEAAAMLGVSRPTLRKLIDSGQLAHVMVGTHHRIPAQALLEFQRERRARRNEAAKALAEFSNEIGLVD